MSPVFVLAMKLYHFAERKALRNSPVQQALLEVHNFRARGSGVEACKLAVSEVVLFSLEIGFTMVPNNGESNGEENGK